MMPVFSDRGDAALCVAEEPRDVEERLCVEVDDELVLVEGDSVKFTLCYNKIIQLMTN